MTHLYDKVNVRNHRSFRVFLRSRFPCTGWYVWGCKNRKSSNSPYTHENASTGSKVVEVRPPCSAGLGQCYYPAHQLAEPGLFLLSSSHPPWRSPTQHPRWRMQKEIFCYRSSIQVGGWDVEYWLLRVFLGDCSGVTLANPNPNPNPNPAAWPTSTLTELKKS